MRLPSLRALFWIGFLLFNFNALYKSSTGKNFRISREALDPMKVKICAVMDCEKIDAIKKAQSDLADLPEIKKEEAPKKTEPFKIIMHENYEDEVPKTLELVEIAQNFLIGMTNSLLRQNQFMPPGPAIFHDGDLGLKIEDYAEGKTYMRRLCKGVGVCFETRESVTHWSDVIEALLWARHMAGVDFPGGAATLLPQWETTKSFFTEKTTELLLIRGLKWPITHALEQNRILLTFKQTLGEGAVNLPSVSSRSEDLQKQLLVENDEATGKKFLHLPLQESSSLTSQGINDKFHLSIEAHGRLLQLMLAWNALAADKFSAETLKGLSHFLMNYKQRIFWQSQGVPAVLEQPFVVHLGARLEALLGLLSYAEYLGDTDQVSKPEIIAFAKNYFEQVRKQTVGDSLGLFGSVENLSRMMLIGLKLTELEGGFYYADVERWLRNQLVEAQIDRDVAAEITAKTSEDEAFDKVNERARGTFLSDATHGFAVPKSQDFRWQTQTQGAAMGAVYQVWRKQVFTEPGKVRVNFLLNRAHELIDMHSLLPYYGAIRFKIKKSFAQPTDLLVRIPPWVSKQPEKLAVYRGGKVTPIEIVESNYVAVKNLQKGEVLQFNFPLAISFEKVGTHTVKMRGDTAVEVSPLSTGVLRYRRTQYAKFTEGPVPQHKVRRYLQSLEP